ncbi:MAG TPA: hypothetical protein ENL03_05910 [Phycisphaerae bacterium]|nr:hypothetical protein [Phycisphaerae bacterium]
MLEQVYLSERLDALTEKMRLAADLCEKLACEHEDHSARVKLAKLCREKRRAALLAERFQEILE